MYQKLPSLIYPFLLLALLLCGNDATAQNTSRYSVMRFRPAVSPLNYFNTEGGITLPHLNPSFGAYLHYDHKPLIVENGLGDEVFKEISFQLNAVLLAAIGFYDHFELGVALPVTIAQSSGDRGPQFPAKPNISGGIGDLRIVPKARLFTVDFFSTALVANIDLPTGSRSNFLSDGRVGVEPRAVFAFDWERVGFATNIGFRFRPQTQFSYFAGQSPITVGNEVFVSGAGRVGLAPNVVDFILDGHATLGVEGVARKERAGEVLAGLRFFMPHGFTANIGGGPGISQAVGTPEFRIFGALFWRPGTEEPPVAAAVAAAPVVEPAKIIDSDGDGIPDDRDRCPYKAEDFDGFEDEDGCPDLDNDADGIVDVDDKCRNEPETFNGVDDFDGCPDRGEGDVQIDRGRITMPPVYFATGKETILKLSFPVLDSVAQLIDQNRWIKRVRIEGHTDSQGSASYNMDLSQRRAESVMRFLRARGVALDRMEAVGFGEDQPIADNATKEGRALNRRVMMWITDPPMGDQSLTSGNVEQPTGTPAAEPSQQ